MDLLIHPTYFPSVSHFVAMVQADSILFETDDNFQKQTNRNRMYIYSANGMQMLNIPIKHSKDIHQKYKDLRIENAFNWQKQHFKSLEAATEHRLILNFLRTIFFPYLKKSNHF